VPMPWAWSYTPPYNTAELVSIACAWLIYFCLRQVR
jgi:hypothetical protein